MTSTPWTQRRRAREVVRRRRRPRSHAPPGQGRPPQTVPFPWSQAVLWETPPANVSPAAVVCTSFLPFSPFALPLSPSVSNRSSKTGFPPLGDPWSPPLCTVVPPDSRPGPGPKTYVSRRTGVPRSPSRAPGCLLLPCLTHHDSGGERRCPSRVRLPPDPTPSLPASLTCEWWDWEEGLVTTSDLGHTLLSLGGHLCRKEGFVHQRRGPSGPQSRVRGRG